MTFWHEVELAAVDLNWSESVGWLAVIWAGVWLLRPLATLLHELGHAIPALLLTSEVVELRVGKLDRERMVDETAKWRKRGRLRWVCSFRGSFHGFTGYDRDALSRAALLVVIAGGPLVSGLACGFAAWLCLDAFEETWQVMVAASFLCANAILFLRSAIPVRLRDGEPSDGLDFWETSRKTEGADATGV